MGAKRLDPEEPWFGQSEFSRCPAEVTIHPLRVVAFVRRPIP